MKLSLYAAPVINMDENQHGLPVILRVYQLRDPKRFRENDFHALWKHDKYLLKKSWVSREDFKMVPNSQKRLFIKRAPHAKCLVVMALFRHPGAHHWSLVLPFKNHWLAALVPSDAWLSIQQNQLIKVR